MYFDLGSRTVVLGSLHGRGGQSGIEVTMQSSAVAEWRDGLCTFHKAYPHKEDVLKELGISEDELEAIAP